MKKKKGRDSIDTVKGEMYRWYMGIYHNYLPRKSDAIDLKQEVKNYVSYSMAKN